MEYVWVLIPIFAILMWGLARIVAAGKSGGAGELRDEVRALREEVDRLRAAAGADQGVEGRLLELEERVDFAERLLARGREPQGPGA